MTPGTYRALENWVQRGGHLVVMLPVTGRTWFDSPLQDLLPDVELIEVPEVMTPRWMGFLNLLKVPVIAFKPGEDVAVLLRDNPDDNRALVVAQKRGLGRVTLIGLDLTNRQLVRNQLPSGSEPWETIFGWQGPAYTAAKIRSLQNDPDERITSSGEMGRVELGNFVIGATGMTATAAGVLFIAVLAFFLYWLLAGPVSFYVLRQQGRERHSWVIFAAFVLAFAGFSWAGAALFRPAKTRVQHFTVLDIDAESRTAHAHSWFSLFVPTHGLTNVAIVQEEDGSTGSSYDTIAAAGLRDKAVADDFINRQRYSFDAAAPYSVDVPMRSTAKQLELDSRLSLNHLMDQVDEGWGTIRGQVSLEGAGVLRGRLTHDLPGDLKNVRIIHMGDKQRAWVWPIVEWKSGEAIDLPIDRKSYSIYLVPRIAGGDEKKGTSYGTGYLSNIVGGQRDDTRAMNYMEEQEEVVVASDSEVMQSVELLTWFDYLPPPKFRDENMRLWVRTYNRAIGREINLSHLVPLDCIVVIGFMQNSEMPVPLRIDGDEIPSTGWTVVRWVLPIESRQETSQNILSGS